MIVNLRNNLIISANCRQAISLYARTRGMIGRKFSNTFDGMFFNRCSSVHTCFMSIPLDLIFTDKNNIVTKTVANVPPWRLAFGGKNSYKVIELPIGVIEKTGTKIGDKLSLNTVDYKDEAYCHTKESSSSCNATNPVVTMK